jgi:hypothetical protein
MHHFYILIMKAHFKLYKDYRAILIVTGKKSEKIVIEKLKTVF